jgi:DNA-binding transcriptional ArsR family regulator
MRIKDYKQMIDYLCRPGYQSGGQVSQLVQPGPGRPEYGGPGSGGGAGSGPKSVAAREKAYIKIFEAQKEFLKKHTRLPTREELIKITKSGPLAIRSAMKKYDFELFNKPGEFKTPPEKKEASYKKRTKTVRSQLIDEPKTIKTQGKRVGVRFPSPKVEEEFIMDLSERFKYPKSSVEGKGKYLTNAGFLKKYYKGKKGFDAASKLDEQINLITKEQGFTYPRQTYEGHKKVSEINKRRRQKFIKKTSSPKMEGIIRGLKAGEDIDLAHRASLREVDRLGTKYLTTSLGLDQRTINQDVVKPFEKEIGRLYDQRNKLVKNVSPGKVPKNIQLQLEEINKKISERVDRTKGRLQGILIDEKTLKPSRYGVNYSKVLGFGLVNKPVSKLTKADLIDIKLNLPQQIKAEKGPGLIKKGLKTVGRGLGKVAWPLGIGLEGYFMKDILDRGGSWGEALSAPFVLDARVRALREKAKRIGALDAGRPQEELIEEFAAKDYRGYAKGGIVSLLKK